MPTLLERYQPVSQSKWTLLVNVSHVLYMYRKPLPFYSCIPYLLTLKIRVPVYTVFKMKGLLVINARKLAFWD